ncbi:MAG: hypothetical protein WAL50_03590 [Kineosporiaceae bacterium]
MVLLVGYLAFQGAHAVRQRQTRALVATIRTMPAPPQMTADPAKSRCNSRGVACFTTSLPPVEAATAIKDALAARGITVGQVSCALDADNLPMILGGVAECAAWSANSAREVHVEASAHARNSLGGAETPLGYTWVLLSVVTDYDISEQLPSIPTQVEDSASALDPQLIPAQWSLSGQCAERSDEICVLYKGDAAIPAEFSAQVAAETLLEGVRARGMTLEDFGCTTTSRCRLVAHTNPQDARPTLLMAFFHVDNNTHRLHMELFPG